MGNHIQSIVIFCIVFLTAADKNNNKCLDSEHHKDAPSPEENFQECTSWEKNSCCDITVSTSIHTHRAKKLYNFHWDKCGTLSQECERYMVNQECFYQCEPRLVQFEKKDSPGAIAGVPVCASYCQKWFKACKNDKTCIEHWLNHWDYDTASGENHCPVNSTCITFEEVYKDPRGLCDKMWGEAFFYEEGDNCMVMQFTGENPNSDVEPVGLAPKLGVAPLILVLSFSTTLGFM